MERAERIEGLSQRITRNAARVRDRVPWWATLLKWAPVALVVGGVIYLLSATGLLGLVRPAVGWLRSLVPSESTHRAKIDAEAVSKGQATAEMREAIAASRASSEVYNQRFRREVRRRRKAEQ